MIPGKRFFTIFCLMLGVFAALSQDDRKDKTAVTYEEIYDEPYSINKLFVHFQPLYGEVFATNVNAGFGLEANYYLNDKFDFKAHFRKTYSKSFYDFARDLAVKNSDVDNQAEVFNYFEFGGTYHLKDFTESSKTKMFLYKNSYKGSKWSARVPLNAEIPCKVRKIYGLRTGGIIWDSSTDINRALESQGLTNADLKNSEGNGLPEGVGVFSNIYSKGLYVGGSMTWIRNVAVSFDKFETGVDDLILTTFFDILVSPWISIDDIVYTPRDANGDPILADRKTYSVAAIKTNMFGFRAGIEGKFNRTLSWSYGAEAGYRPSIDGKGFFAMLKISIPVYSTNLDYKVEAFGK
ncbi:MAG: hypothetical protein KF687_07295 [Cyclobacteriaceae bacterium]|nr:hypothetical protein [Cyclobacteriaceae bacterium]